MMYQLVLI